MSRSLIYNFLSYSGIAGLYEIFSKPSTGIVLVYHRVTPVTGDDYILEEMITPPKAFEIQMGYLIKKYKVVSLHEFLGYLSSDRSKPENLVTVTFDDAYADNYKYALPILKKHRIPATIFVPTAFIETDRSFWWDILAYLLTYTKKNRLVFANRNKNFSLALNSEVAAKKAFCALSPLFKYCDGGETEALLGSLADILEVKAPQNISNLLKWDNMLEMAENGISFGAHTHGHRSLSSLEGLRLREEIAGPKHILESRLGSEIAGFAYPYGEKKDLSGEALDFIFSAGYKAAFTMIQGRIAPIDNLFLLPRIGVGGTDTIAIFKMKLSGLVPLRKKINLR